jgi:hypothetical protein
VAGPFVFTNCHLIFKGSGLEPITGPPVRRARAKRALPACWPFTCNRRLRPWIEKGTMHKKGVGASLKRSLPQGSLPRWGNEQALGSGWATQSQQQTGARQGHSGSKAWGAGAWLYK